MLKFRVSKSGFYQIAKSIAGDSYDKVYKDIISFMKDLEKKEESKEVKKAIEYFESSESNFSHLEKSVNGDWIEKAGYGVGTIRIWKGKKYKKISASPTRWVRVFDKNDRGAKNAMTRLIHEAEKYKNDPEGMMKLLLANKQRFYDEDSKRYLDIVDRLNAFVDNADSTGPMGENQVKEIHNKIEENKKKGKKVTPYEAQKQIDDEKLMNKVKEINANAKEKEESESKMPDVSKLSRDEILSEMAKQVKLKTNKDEKYYEALRTELDKYNKVAEQLRNEAGEKIDIDNFPLGKIGKKIDGEYPRFNIEQQKKLANRIIEQYGKTDKTRQLLGKLMDFNSQKNQYLPYNPYGDSWDYIESKINIEPKESEPYNPDDPSNKTNPAYKKQFEHTMNRLKAGMSAREKTQMITDAYSMLANDEYSKEGKIVVQADLDAIEQFESEAEKHQNRSNAMMGNDNAKKDGKSVEEIEREERHAKAELNNKVKTLVDENTNYTEKDIQIMLDRVHMNRYSPSVFDFDMQQNDLNIDIDVMTDALKRQLQGENVGQTQKRLLEIIKEDKAKIEAIDIARKEFKDGKWKEVYSGAYEYQEPEPAKTTKSTPSTESPFSVSESSDYENKPPIATNVKSGENEVTMPYSKELNEELKTLKNCVAGDYSTNKAMQNIYYSDGNLVTTDGRRLKIVKVGELDGIPNNSFVDFDSNKSGIKIKKIEVNSPFPKYSQVIPKDLNNKATLNNKVLKEKIKEMQKDGAIQKKTDNSVQLEIKDGNILIDDTIVGKTDVKDLKWSRNWGEEQTRTNYISINADYLVNALNGNESVLMMGDNASKAMTVNTGSTVNVLMPMYGSDQKVDYSEGRQKKTEENQRKSKLKEIYRNSMDDYMKDLNSQTSDESYERLKNAVANADKKILQTAYDAYKKADKQYKNSSGGNIYDNRYGFKLLATAQKYPDFKTIFMDAVQKQGIEVKKSLFDFMDPFILDEIEIDDSDEEELQNYDASTPELFNSTSYKVADALDECFGCK